MKKRFLYFQSAILGTVIFLMSIGMGFAAAPSMVLILDASGSMWGKIDGKPKIQIARDVITDLIDAIPQNFETGLMVYGHRQKGDCNDIEMVVPVGLHNPAGMKAKIQSVSPKGMTPLSEAVRQAAVALRYTEQRATVVLVSDGLETCDKDPCAVAAEIAMSGVDFTVHVIGFDISKEDQGRLRCLADRTGGLFLTADNAHSLRDALFKTVEEVKAPPAPVVENPGIAEVKCPESVPVGSVFNVQWKGPNSRGDYICIADKNSKDQEYTDYVYTKLGNPIDMTAPGKVGDYEVRYIHAQSHKAIGRAPIKVTPVQASLQVPKEADAASKIEVTWQGPAYPGDYITLARPEQNASGYLFYTYTQEGSPLKLQAPSEPGTYEVRYILGKGNESLAKAIIQIKGVSASVQAPPSVDMASEITVTWQGPGNKGDYISIAKPNQEPGGYVHYTYTQKGASLKLQAPPDPGIYEIRYILGHGNKLLAKTAIEIRKVEARVSPPNTGAVNTDVMIPWQGPGYKSDYITISRPDQQPSAYLVYTYVKTGNPVKIKAPKEAGTYEVRYILGEGNKLLDKAIIVIK